VKIFKIILAASCVFAMTWASAQAAPTTLLAPSNTPKVQFKTSLGDFTVALDAKAAPKTVENFLKYVNDKHYDGTVFHRVIQNFMVQGGGFDKEMKQKPTRAPVAIESDNGLKNDVGTIAMARTSDPNSATAQFFINVLNNERLNKPSFDGWGYTVFGKVTEGMDTIEKIRAVAVTNRSPHQNVPTTPVVIESARLIK
jgi:peptidyl-prolyl cis-trans isomerase A (cyclophilin A)